MARDIGENRETECSLQLCFQRVAVADPWTRIEIPEIDPNTYRNSMYSKANFKAVVKEELFSK